MSAHGAAQAVTAFLETLTIPEGPLAGETLKLAEYQERFVRGALADGVNIACLSVGRGNAKTAISAGIALSSLLGIGDPQPRRLIVIAARTRDQARIAFDFVVSFIEAKGDELGDEIHIRRAPRLEIEYSGDGGGHILRCISADSKSALGTSPTFCLMDERGHWPADRGDDLENALLSGLGKRGGRALLISTSAPDDNHAFSVWLDNPDAPGVYVQEHRAAPGLPADDLPSLIDANPGAVAGIGSSIEWLQAEARRAIARGGATLNAFRLYNRNERVSGESRDLLLTADEWMTCETSELPEHTGQCIVGIDLGGSAAMSAAAYYWPETGRLEALATFPSVPDLSARGANDGVSGRYVEMRERGELSTLGDRTVPIAPWLSKVMAQVQGEHIGALIADRYKQAELGEAIDKAGIRCPVIWRGTGWKDGGEDCERFRRAAYDGGVRSKPSLLMRSAFSEAVVLKDPAGNLKLAKARAKGRIDAVQASVIAVAEGARRVARPATKARVATWV